ncbi:hypothetical protein MIND_00550000 [Mycena indigotica]|uniref:Uncharacterized protein n=1 Tax=Mycena indigotica TaxID=2126181 RepID=A0A8H6SZC4_9AGAR|nr:uncharacterized protein MIND_00550000 [Mycena indigotica]KAF7307552.1 hypothetical protein MIND_00550000 [Mycena indigotica]
MSEQEDTPHYVPERGSFSVMTLDPVASVAYLEDPEATAAAAALDSKGYVIYLPGVRTLFSPHAAFREEIPYFVQRGIPRDIPAQHVDASMSLPISPQTSSAEHHPSTRAPLTMATNAFPWADCYLAAFLTTTVRSPNVRVVDRVVCELDRAERFRVIQAINADDDLRDDRLEEQRQREKAALVETNGHGNAGDQEQAPVDEAEAVAIFRELISNEAEEHLLVANFTYDLSRVGEVHDVREYWAEAERIAAIVAASLARKEAEKRAIAEKDAARYDTRTAELLHGHQAARATGLRIRRTITRSAARAKALFRRILFSATRHRQAAARRLEGGRRQLKRELHDARAQLFNAGERVLQLRLDLRLLAVVPRGRGLLWRLMMVRPPADRRASASRRRTDSASGSATFCFARRSGLER